jgi:hypothetical protein
VQTQFTPTAGVVGTASYVGSASNTPGANKIFLRRVQAQINCTLNSVSLYPLTTSGTAKFKAVAYADSSGVLGSLLSSGTEVVGSTNGTILVGSLVTPQSLTAGTYYWVGFICDTSIALLLTDSASTVGALGTNTYTSGAPATPTMTYTNSNWMLYGNIVSPAANWPLVSQTPVLGDISATTSSTVNNEDLFGFPALSTTPAIIYTVAVKAAIKKDSGARTIDLRMKSVSTTGSGSSTGQTPSGSYLFACSFFNKDPNTSASWAAAALNSASSGIKVVT